VNTCYFRNYFYNHRNILNSITRDLHGVKNNFLFSDKNLPAVSLISLLNCCLTAQLKKKCMLSKSIYLKIHHKSLWSHNSGNTSIGRRVIPIFVFPELFHNADLWCILKYIDLRSILFSTKRAVKQQFKHEMNETRYKSLTGNRNFFRPRGHLY